MADAAAVLSAIAIGAGILDVGAATGAMFAQKAATRMKIDEAVRAYYRDIAELDAKISTQQGLTRASMDETRRIGVEELKEVGREAGFQARTGYTTAERLALSAENRIGASGVRAIGSPVMGAQQDVDLAFAAVDRNVERGESALKIGGLRLASSLAKEQRTSTALTEQWGRQRRRQQAELDELWANKETMEWLAFAGGLPGLTASFYNASQTFSNLLPKSE